MPVAPAPPPAPAERPSSSGRRSRASRCASCSAPWSAASASRCSSRPAPSVAEQGGCTRARADRRSRTSTTTKQRGGRWQELRLGFFSTEAEARTYAASLPAPYVNSIVVVADVAEQDRAQTGAATLSAQPQPTIRRSRCRTGDYAAGALARAHGGLIAEADEAMLAGDHDTAIRLYARLLEEPGFRARREARERLGLARERKGQVARARVEYAAYLAEFPDGADAERVRQRLAGVDSEPAPARAPLAETEDARSLWEVERRRGAVRAPL